jgi:hypothetical protein
METMNMEVRMNMMKRLKENKKRVRNSYLRKERKKMLMKL